MNFDNECMHLQVGGGGGGGGETSKTTSFFYEQTHVTTLYV